jgi:hypothetical protein
VRIKRLAPILTSLLLFSASTYAVETKPNFSGTWILDKENSQLGDKSGRSHHQGSGGGRGGFGMGIPGLGIPGMGGPRMGGPGMGGSRTGRPGMGEPGNGQDPSMGTGEPDRQHTARVPETMIIQHTEPQLIIQQKTHIEGEEQVRELKYTTDGNTNRNEGYRGYEMESHTSWKDEHLETKSTAETSTGKIKITELRSLSPDGRTMTVEIKSSGGDMDRHQTLIYNKQ